MSRLRLIFILSLIAAAGVFISAIYFIPSSQSCPESKKIQIIEGNNEWILECDLINNKETDAKYTISVTVDSVTYLDSTVVEQGKTYTYIRHIYPHELTEGKVTFALYEEGKAEPIDHFTYHLDYD